MNPLLNIGIQAIRNAGKALVRLMNYFDTKGLRPHSANHTLIDLAHQHSTSEMTHIIRKHYAQHPIQLKLDLNQPKPVQWMLQPLDGALNFARGIPHFALALSCWMRNKLSFGIVYDPIRDELFTAERGSGAAFNSYKMKIKPVKKSDTETVVAVNGHFLSSKLLRCETRDHPKTEVYCTGCDALDMAYLAMGRLDAYCGLHVHMATLSAGVLLILESGGYVQSFKGDGFDFSSKDVMAFSNLNLKKHIFSE